MAPGEHQLLAQQLAREVFPQARTLIVSKTQTGISTWVYRIERDGVHFYLRILPELNASFAPEVYVHSMLAARNLHVPEIVYFEHYNSAFQRSVVVTSAIAGSPIAEDASSEAMVPILEQAGRELAQLNQVPVKGFGWIQRTVEHVDSLYATYSNCAEWISAEIEHALAVLTAQELLLSAEIIRLERLLAQAIELFSNTRPTLAHGDFDLTHIFHSSCEYTGIIDFGEIRGAYPLYDLGHFAIENARFLPALLTGYESIKPLPTDHEAQILQASLLIAVIRMGRRAARHKNILAMDRRIVDRVLNMAT